MNKKLKQILSIINRLKSFDYTKATVIPTTFPVYDENKNNINKTDTIVFNGKTIEYGIAENSLVLAVNNIICIKYTDKIKKLEGEIVKYLYKNVDADDANKADKDDAK